MADPDPRLSYSLSPSQTRIFLEDALPAAKLGVNIGQIVCTTTEDFHLPAFTEAWQTIANRNAALGVSFTRDDRQQPYQRIYLPVEIPVFTENRPETTASDKEAFVHEWLAQDRRNLFDLSETPLTRVAVFRFGDQSVTWVWTFHQILMDDRSSVLVLEDFFACYEALGSGRPVDLPDREPFGNFISWHEKWTAEQEASDRLFWGHLITSDEIDAMLSIKGAIASPDYQQGKVSLDPDEATTDGLSRLAVDTGLTLKTIVQGAWALLLSRYYRSRSVTFGTIRFSRSGSLAGAESMIGTLMNFLPVHAEVSPDVSVRDLLRGIQKQQEAMRDHRWTSLEVIRNSLPAAASKQLFDSCVVHQRARPAQELAGRFGLGGVRTFSIREASNLPLLLSASEEPRLAFDLVYRASLFEKEEIDQLGRSFLALLGHIPAAPDTPAGAVQLLVPNDQTHVMRLLSGPELAVPEDRCLQHGFEEQARRTPHQLAVIAECELTYEQLDRRATALAVRLNRMGIGTDQLVAIFLPRSSAVLVAMLGVLKSGAAYFPLDVELPKARLQSLTEDAQAAAVITDEGLAHAAPALGAPLVLVNAAEEIPAEISGASLPSAHGSHLAYAISTSGTTGRPKLIGVEHRQVANLLTFATGTLLQAEDVRWVPFIDLPSFDSSISQIFTTLALGGTLVCVRDITEIRGSPFYDRFTCLGSTPSLLSVILSTTGLPPSVRTIGLGAEAIPPELLEKLDHLPQIQKVINYYGPSEATVYCTLSVLLNRADPTHLIDLRNRGRVIGRPIANARAYVVDEFGQLAPPGALGELCIAGAPVARGYLNAVGEAAKNFLPDPFHPGGGRMYRTGDIACLRPDGQLEFHGRRDHQLKFNGVRIEAAEIEAALQDFPGVHQAGVDLRRDSAGVRRLVAYVAADAAVVSRQELKRALRLRLPDSMIPHHFLFLAHLPLSANGKVDREALSRIEFDSQAPAGPIAALTAAERQMITLWEKNLSRGSIGLADDYFELGGDSLSAVNLVAAIDRQLGLRIKASVLFDNSTIADLLPALYAAKNASAVNRVPACSFVCLQQQGDEAPLIILPGGSGTSVPHYKNFAQKFGPDHPVYALQAAFSLMPEKAAEPLASISRDVAGKVLATAGGRPFVLFGHCLGGLLAWHVACLLKKRNSPPFRLMLYDAPAVQDGVNKTGDLSEADAHSRLQLLIKAYRPAWDEWRMDHGTAWWTNVTFVHWMFTNFLVRRGWVRSGDERIEFVKLSYLRLMEESRLDVYPDDTLLIYHQAQESIVSHSLWPSVCGGNLQVEYIPGNHRVWQTSILALRPLVLGQLNFLQAAEPVIA